MQRRLGAKCQVVHNDGACGGYREQRAVVRERQCIRVWMGSESPGCAGSVCTIFV